jgi:plastocyanin
MIPWQEDLIKRLENPKVITYDDLDSGPVASEFVPATEVSIVKNSWDPKVPKPYTPSAIQVSAGSSVTWTNNDSVMHTVTSDGNFDSGFIQAGQQWSYAFESHGIYNYYCTLHPWMKGAVDVEHG